MTIVRIALLVACLLFVSCDDRTSDDGMTGDGATDVAAAASFFATVGSARQTLHSDDQPSNLGAASALAWLNNTIPTSIENPDGQLSYVLSSATPGSAGAYALQRHAELGFPALEDGQSYIQIQCIPRGLACPELHGVIDPAGPTLLSYWGEGG